MSGGWRAIVGVAVWLVSVVPQVPNLHHGAWAHALIALAALVLVPLAIEVAERPERVAAARQLLRWAARLQLPGALLLVVALRLPPGPGAMMAAGVWSVVLGLIAASGGVQLWKTAEKRAVAWCNEAGLVFAAVGAVWLLADRAGIRPLGFSEDIVLLTAVHFHYAGLIVPVLASRALEAVKPGRASTVIALAVVAGVPAVALGITASQLGWSGVIEAGAALLMSAAGAAVAIVHVWLGVATRRAVLVRCLWVIAGCSLFAGMLLSALYGLRDFVAPWPWLDIPWMRALHGTVNALGFGVCGTLGWWWVRRRCQLRMEQEG